MKPHTHADHRLGSLRDVWIDDSHRGTQAKTACRRWLNLWDDPEKKKWDFNETPTCPRCQAELTLERVSAEAIQGEGER